MVDDVDPSQSLIISGLEAWPYWLQVFGEVYILNWSQSNSESSLTNHSELYAWAFFPSLGQESLIESLLISQWYRQRKTLFTSLVQHLTYWMSHLSQERERKNFPDQYPNWVNDKSKSGQDNLLRIKCIIDYIMLIQNIISFMINFFWYL